LYAWGVVPPTNSKITMIRDAEISYEGIFSIPDVALFLRATTPPQQTPISIWKVRRRPFAGPSSRQLQIWIAHWLMYDRDSRHRSIDFAELVRLRLIFLMRTRGLSLKTILRAELMAQELTKLENPFATERLWSNRSAIFMEVADFIVAISKNGQLAMPEILEYLDPLNHGLEFDPNDGAAQVWTPLEGIVIDPELQFGSPCIEGTRIETEVIASLAKTVSISQLAEMYSVAEEQIESALSWEMLLTRAA
jgi:uncharacterized protein (DUF433 family)